MQMTGLKFLLLHLEKLPVLVGVDMWMKRFSIPPRFRSAVIDQMGMTLVVMVVLSPLLVYDVYQTVQHGSPPADNLWTMIYVSFGFSIYINKDAFNGRSIGKRICGLQIVDRKTNEVASSLKCMVRNITFLVWPLEVIILLVTRNRRLGDFIMNTEIVQYSHMTNVKFSWLQFASSIIIGTVLLFFIFKLEIL